MKKLLLILICLFVYSCDEPEKKTKSELDIKQSQFIKKYNLNDSIGKLLSLKLDSSKNRERTDIFIFYMDIYRQMMESVYHNTNLLLAKIKNFP